MQKFDENAKKLTDNAKNSTENAKIRRKLDLVDFFLRRSDVLPTSGRQESVVKLVGVLVVQQQLHARRTWGSTSGQFGNFDILGPIFVIFFRGIFRGISWKNDFSKLLPRKIPSFPTFLWGKFSAEFSPKF
jgi:hypothetical protein